MKISSQHESTGYDKELARRTATRLSSRVIRALQRLTNCKLSGDDSVLHASVMPMSLIIALLTFLSEVNIPDGSNHRCGC
jgi:hypothetical protein